MPTQYVVSFTDPARIPELIVADAALVAPDSGALLLVSGDLADPATLVTRAVYLPGVATDARRLPDQPHGAWGSLRRCLRWLS